MDRTNYPVLSIVAIVTIVAIVAIFLNARASTGITPLPQGLATVANAVLDVPMTGHVTADTGVTSVTAQAGNRYDLNNDGVIDAGDAKLLGDVIDRVRFCPVNKLCDINADGAIDMQDLGALNAMIVATPQPAPALPTPQAAAADSTSQIGSFGAMA